MKILLAVSSFLQQQLLSFNSSMFSFWSCLRVSLSITLCMSAEAYISAS